MKLEIPQHIMLKLQAWRDMGTTEVTGFFITEKDNIFKVIDALIVKAKCTAATVDIDAEAIEQMYIEQSQKGIYPDQLMIWWHTHPGNSATPSGTDEATFKSLGKDRTLNVMYILAQGGNEFAQVSVTDIASQFMLKKSIEVEHPFTMWEDFPTAEELKTQYDENVEIGYYAYNYAGYGTGGGYGVGNRNVANRGGVSQFNKGVRNAPGNNKSYSNGFSGGQIQKANAAKKTTTVTPDKSSGVQKKNCQENNAEENAASVLVEFDQKDKEFLIELDQRVLNGELTADEADVEAMNEGGFEWGIYTQLFGWASEPEDAIYPEVIDDAPSDVPRYRYALYEDLYEEDNEETDPVQRLISTAYARTQTDPGFFSEIQELEKAGNLTAADVSKWLRTNNKNYYYDDGQFFPFS